MRLKEFLLLSFLALGAAAKHGESEGNTLASTSGSASPGSSSTSTTVISAQTSPSPPATSPAPGSSASQAPTSSSPSQSSSSTSPSPSVHPSSIPIQFNLVNNMTTCQSVMFSWTSFSDTPVTLTIAVTNDRSTQNNVVVRQAQTTLVTQVISSNTSSTTGSIRWPTVDVPVGKYAVLAFQTENQNAGMVESNLFNVTSGNNTACLNAATSSTSLPVASTTNSATPSNASDSTEGSSSSGGTSKSLSTGALIGVVVGVVLGVLSLIIVFTLMHRKVFRVRRPRRPGAPYYLF